MSLVGDEAAAEADVAGVEDGRLAGSGAANWGCEDKLARRSVCCTVLFVGCGFAEGDGDSGGAMTEANLEVGELGEVAGGEAATPMAIFER